MSDYGPLRVGQLEIRPLRNDFPDDLLISFCDHMRETRRLRESDYTGQSTLWEGFEDEEQDPEIEIVEMVGSGREIRDRLDLLGFSETITIRCLDEELESSRKSIKQLIESSDGRDVGNYIRSERDMLDGLDGRLWVTRLREALGDTTPEGSELISRLMRHVHFLDDRVVLRAALMALPDATVRVDITDLVNDGYLADRDAEGVCSGALEIVRDQAAVHSPVVVLTEGRSDVAVLTRSLSLLYPHLVDLIKFMDFEGRPEGGTSALLRTVKSFAAAGIANRVVALFDNDTAAADTLRLLKPQDLPSNIRVLRYPDLDFARRYPTLGPPTLTEPAGHLDFADVNGSAGSIELYLGRDVLNDGNGGFLPVQWRSYIPGMRQYQGEIIEKDRLHKSFNAKLLAAQKDRSLLSSQDWSGIRAILESIRSCWTDPAQSLSQSEPQG
ncbi:hypothetical protein I6A84_02305 [Frankia sp. CNm7]|uniref:HEPN/Toprim N-terminal domain-containing protein n=1 Tax=Frankia nepalensis TaxID=1836974 RepID=A0A937RKU4_9ACTN|nr:hypothetical protein [Frankia nepalensis]MBL7500965.1 hypothetical protein [Frankia nepalensis]MBL7512417.1 hypothetical protein [Frankia nepalensis]MBL7516990.1 hypothetical protein [Frankia nepalensis]MBL7631972.1 hypothetical protein [Frankia nepalensis]